MVALPIVGRARVGLRTKELVPWLRRGDVAFIQHRDLDPVAARALQDRGVRAVVNGDVFASGEYPSRGALLLLEGGVHLVEAVGLECLRRVHDGEHVVLQGGEVYQRGKRCGSGQVVRRAALEARLAEGKANLGRALSRFLQNTLDFAQRECDLVAGPLPLPALRTRLRGRPALVVVRGADYQADLRMIQPFVNDVKPVLIGVDGGADALLELGLRPHVIVGDMDSVSDRALRSGAELVVHAYRDGRAPGLERLGRQGLRAKVVPLPGTSEDLALLLAYEAEAEPIVAVGTHSSLVDFLDKGRPGMASTFLVRMKVGHVLVDARGVSKLYRGGLRPLYLGPVVVAALLPASAILALTPPAAALLELWWLQLRLTLGF